jgi:hypothetical protein
MRYIARNQVVTVIDALFRFYVQNRQDGEELGYFHRRIGMSAIIEKLQSCPETAALMLNINPADTQNQLNLVRTPLIPN